MWIKRVFNWWLFAVFCYGSGSALANVLVIAFWVAEWTIREATGTPSITRPIDPSEGVGVVGGVVGLFVWTALWINPNWKPPDFLGKLFGKSSEGAEPVKANVDQLPPPADAGIFDGEPAPVEIEPNTGRGRLVAGVLIKEPLFVVVFLVAGGFGAQIIESLLLGLDYLGVYFDNGFDSYRSEQIWRRNHRVAWQQQEPTNGVAWGFAAYVAFSAYRFYKHKRPGT